MANLSEPERKRLSALVASSIQAKGMTEVSRITGLSTTVLRQFATSVPAGVRAASVAGINRLAEPSEDQAASPIEALTRRIENIETLIIEVLAEVRAADRRTPPASGPRPGDRGT